MGMSPWKTKAEIDAIPYIFHLLDITCECGNKWTEIELSILTHDNALGFTMHPCNPNGIAMANNPNIVGYASTKLTAAFCPRCFTSKLKYIKEIEIKTEPTYTVKKSSIDTELDNLFGEPSK